MVHKDLVAMENDVLHDACGIKGATVTVLKHEVPCNGWTCA